MTFNVDFSFHFVDFVIGLLAWGMIGLIAYNIYRKQEVRPKIWKVIIFIFIGIFSFSINWSMDGVLLRFSVLPLGVWILYFFSKGKEGIWQRYRSFAWLGFMANYLFLAATLLSIAFNQMLYPKDEPNTYISTIEEGSIISVHPSGKNKVLNKESLMKELPTMSQETIVNDLWYEDTYADMDPTTKDERFPYQFIGTKPKWGSGLRTNIFIESDGKGILVSTQDKQLYFRSEQSILMEGEEK